MTPEYGFEQKSFQSNAVRFVFVVLFLGVVFVWAIFLSPDHGGLIPPPFHKDLWVDFVNVGQGDAILLRTPRGRNYLVDGGVNVSAGEARQTGRELIQNFLRRQRIYRLDGVVVTHPHNDHLGGIVPVLNQCKVDRVWDCGSRFDTVTFKDYESLCEKKRIPRETAKAGDVLDWGEDLFVQVLHPAEVSNSQGYSDLNNMSVTLLVRYGKVNLLLCGDIEEFAQREVAKFGADLKAQIIKVPHHGSDTSIYEPFLRLVTAGTGVIQVGRGNPFGHPKVAMLDLYQRLGTKLYRNDYHGNIHLDIGGTKVDDFTFKVDRDI